MRAREGWGEAGRGLEGSGAAGGQRRVGRSGAAGRERGTHSKVRGNIHKHNEQ